jgi:hypothetical protein
MNRSRRVAVTAAAASALIAGGIGAVTLGPVGASGFATSPVPGAAPADPTDLHAAVTRLASEATALQVELVGARHRLDHAGSTAPGTAAVQRTVSAPSVAARHVRAPVPAVHTRTGASASAGRERNEADDD